MLDRLGQRAEAATLFAHALAAADHSRFTRITALIGLAGAEPSTGHAIDRGAQAVNLAEEGGYHMLTGRALSTLALLHRGFAPPEAAGYAHRALARSTRTATASNSPAPTSH